MNDKRFSRMLLWGVLVFAPTIVWGASSVRFVVADSDIRVGETFTVDVVVDGVVAPDEVFAFGFDIVPPAAFTEVAPPAVSAPFTDDSALFPATDVAGSVFPTGPNGDGIVLATLSFSCASAGVFGLSVVSDLLDPNEGLFTLFDRVDLDYAGDVTINANVPEEPPPVEPVPAVSAWGLMLLGLLLPGLAVFARRRR